MTTKEEADYRIQLIDELPDRAYLLGGGSFVAYTGKIGYIDYLVALKKESGIWKDIPLEKV